MGQWRLSVVNGRRLAKEGGRVGGWLLLLLRREIKTAVTAATAEEL